MHRMNEECPESNYSLSGISHTCHRQNAADSPNAAAVSTKLRSRYHELLHDAGRITAYTTDELQERNVKYVRGKDILLESQLYAIVPSCWREDHCTTPPSSSARGRGSLTHLELSSPSVELQSRATTAAEGTLYPVGHCGKVPVAQTPFSQTLHNNNTPLNGHWYRHVRMSPEAHSTIELSLDLVYDGVDLPGAPSAEELFATISHIPFVLTYVDGDSELSSDCGRLAYAMKGCVRQSPGASYPLSSGDLNGLSHSTVMHHPLGQSNNRSNSQSRSNGASEGSPEVPTACRWQVLFTNVSFVSAPEPHSVHMLLVSQAPTRYSTVPNLVIPVVVTERTPKMRLVRHSDSCPCHTTRGVLCASEECEQQELFAHRELPDLLRSASASGMRQEPSYTSVDVKDPSEPLSACLHIQADSIVYDVEFSVKTQVNGRCLSTFTLEFLPSELIRYMQVTPPPQPEEPSDEEAGKDEEGEDRDFLMRRVLPINWCIPITIPVTLPLSHSHSKRCFSKSGTAVNSAFYNDSNSCEKRYLSAPQAAPSARFVLQADVRLTSAPKEVIRETFPIVLHYSPNP